VKTNNNRTNLRWTTHAVNNGADKVRHHKLASGERSGASKLSEKDIRLIRKAARRGVSLRTIGSQFSVTGTNIYYIVHRKTWGHIA